jgi:hypothetical protein
MLLRRINEWRSSFTAAAACSPTRRPASMSIRRRRTSRSMNPNGSSIGTPAARRRHERARSCRARRVGYQREGFTWKTENKYRVLTRGGPRTLQSGWTARTAIPFSLRQGQRHAVVPTADDFITRRSAVARSTTSRSCSSARTILCPSRTTRRCSGLSNLALAIYRGEADYRSTLFYQGQQTLVIIGGNVDDATKIKNCASATRASSTCASAATRSTSASARRPRRDAPVAGRMTKLAPRRHGRRLPRCRQQIQGRVGEALRIRVAARTTTISSVAQAAGAGWNNS